MLKIDTIKNNERMSTQDLLLTIEDAVKAGETDFDIAASGQHDIGGPLWHPEGKTLKFHVTNAGQRVGSMCLPNTEIIVEGSTSADVGWLNAGGLITVKGDAGDTAGHCSSGGKIYIGGRAGTRTGSLMKHDPLYEEPELWVLKNVGSFSFEFMGGGRAVVCGVDCAEFSSILGERACVGMVGGIVYFRGKISDYPADILCLELDESDIAFLKGGMNHFLNAIEKSELIAELSDWREWKKLRPLTFEEKKPQVLPDLAAFRKKDWVKDGIFSDVAVDDFDVLNTVNRGIYRLRVPSWDNAKFSAPCQFFCPTGIPTQKRFALLRQGKVDETFDITKTSEYAEFIEAMDDDLNTSKALAVLFDLVTKSNKGVEGAYTTLYKLATTLGFTFEKATLSEDELKEVINKVNEKVGKSYGSMEDLIEDRKKARTEKNWDLADKIRISLDDAGIILKDSKNGTTWEVK